MKCPNCEKEIRDESKFCNYCGANIEKILYFEEHKEELLKNTKPYFGERLKDLSKIFFIIGIFGVLLMSFATKQSIVGGYYVGYSVEATNEFDISIFLAGTSTVLISCILLWCLGEHLINQRKQIELLEELNSKQK